MESFLKINGITHNKTTPLWSLANGQVEPINRVFKKIMQSAGNDGRNWKHKLDIFLWRYRNPPHCTKGETPFSFCFLGSLGTTYQLFQVLLIVQDKIM